MRKLLLATTALASAAFVAGAGRDAAAQTQNPASPPAAPKPERIKLGLGGYFQQWGVYNNQDIDNTRGPTSAANGTPPAKIKNVPFDNKHNAEVCVIGQTTLDNGLTIGVNVQLEAFSANDSIDEAYLFVQSPTYGQLVIGDENNAGYLLHVTAPDGGVSLDSGDLCNIDAFINTGITSYFDTSLCTTNLRFTDNDSGKFTYITPRFAGLQAGVSFIPVFEGGGDDNSSVYFNNTGFGGPSDGNTGGGSNTGATNRNRYKNGWAGGVNYTEKFGEFGVQASAGGLYAQKGQTARGLGVDGSDLAVVNTGAQVSFAGFSFGGAYQNALNKNAPLATFTGGTASSAATTVNTTTRSQSYTIGAAYEFGPYKVGIDYMKGWGPFAIGSTKEQSLDQGVLSGTWTLGPGIRLVGGVFGYNIDTGNACDSAGSTAGAPTGCTGYDSNGVGVASGLKLAF